MKSLLKTLKWTSAILVGLLLIALIILAIIGVPKPPSISSEQVPRLPWKFASNMYGIMQDGLKSTSFNNWNPGEEKIYIWANSGGLRSKLHVLSDVGGKPQLVEGLPNNSRSYRLNPDPEKKYLIYALDKGGNEQYQLYRFDLETRTSQLLTDGENRFGSAIFDKAGKRIAYGSNKRNKKDRDIYVMDPEDPSSEKLVHQVDGSWYLGEWSPQGDRIIALHYVSVNESYPYIIHVDSQTVDSMALESEIPVSYGALEWSADGQSVYYTSDYESEFKRIRFRNLETGQDSLLPIDINWDVTSMDLSPDGKYLAFRVNEDAVGQIYLMDTKTGAYKKFDKLPFGTAGGLSFHPANNTFALNHTPPSGLTSIYSYNLENEALVQWTNPKKGEEANMPDPEIIHFPTFDFDSISGKQREIAAFYHKPSSEVKKPYPVFISIHGGPEGQSGTVRGAVVELFLKQGIAVLVPNVRGSTGYGKSFSKLDNGMLRENSVKDIGALLDWIATQSDLNKEKVAVYGGSYGGYMVLGCAVHYSDRLTCAIDLFGISNFVTFLENTKTYRRDLRRVEYGDERDPEMRAFLEKISPLNNVEKIKIPLMVYQGKNDPRVPQSESRQLVDKIRESGREVWYIEASNEGHSLSQPMNQIYVGAAGFRFVEEYLLSN